MSKKSTKATKEFRQYETGDPVLGKIRGYPPWPGVVVDPASAPPAVQSEHPPGKKATFHCVLFFPTGDYAWLHAKDMSSLKPHEIEAFLADESKKRNGELREGYRIALDPKSWMVQRLEAAQAMQDAEENAQVDQLESEHDEVPAEEDTAAGGVTASVSAKKAKAATGAGAGAATKKRKRESEAGEMAAAAPPKTAKKAPKTKKDVAEPPAKKASAAKASGTAGAGKAKKNGAKAKTNVESEDDAEGAEVDEGDGADAGPSMKEKASPPPAKKTRRDKDDDGDDNKTGDPLSMKVRDWRHKLQKTFLSVKTLPKAESMAEIDQLFTTVETYEEITIEQLQFSKIGKVMRHIAALPDDKSPPRDAEFRFRSRAKALVDKWHAILNANRVVEGVRGPGGVDPHVSGAGVGATNGNGKEQGKQEGGESKDGQGEEQDAEMGDAEGEPEHPEHEAEAEAEAEGEPEESVEEAKKDVDAEGEGEGEGEEDKVEGEADKVALATKGLDLNGTAKADAPATTATTTTTTALAAADGTAEDEQDAPADADADVSMAVDA